MTIKSKFLLSVTWWVLGLFALFLFMANLDLIVLGIYSMCDWIFEKMFELLNYFRFD